MNDAVSSTTTIDPTAVIGVGVQLSAATIRIGSGVVIDDGVVIEADAVDIADGARIGMRTTVRATRFSLGYRSSIGNDCVIGGVGSAADVIDIGDLCTIGAFNTILLPSLTTGDYVALHHHSLTSGYAPCVIGHNTWIGQNCVLNCTDHLTIGNNVGLGAYSAVYTHAYNGELLEGCQIWHTAPVTIEDNAWIVGSYNVISPGVTVGRRSMILTGSVVSKDVPPLHTFAGVPARDLTDRLTPFRDLEAHEKRDLMVRFVAEFAAERNAVPVAGGYRVSAGAESYRVLVLDSIAELEIEDERTLVYAMKFDPESDVVPENVVVFDVATKRYTKRLSDPEIEIIRFMNGFRARFVPFEKPQVGAD